MRPISSIHLLLSLSILFGCAAAVPPPVEAPKSASLDLASTEWPPFTAGSGSPRVASELVELALSSDSVEVEESIVPVETWIDGIRDGRFDGSAAVWWSEERERYLLFSEPYLENRLVLVGHADSDVSATAFSELAGKRIGIVEDYAYGEALEGPAGEPGPSFVEMQSTPANLRALLAGELDYVLADALFAQYSVVTHPQRQELKVGEAALVSRTLHFAVRKDLPGAKELIAHFDSRVRQMLRDGTYNQVLGFRWIKADIDGDGHAEYIFGGDQLGEEAPEEGYRVHTPDEDKPKAEFEFQPDYVINGEKFDGWDNIPDSYKVEGAGGVNVGIGVKW